MTRTKAPSIYDDLIDSRDVDARIEELNEHDVLSEEDEQELAALIALRDDARDYAEAWKHGVTLISDDYFEEYAQGLAEECGLLPAYTAWPLTHIDWEAAARALQEDYTSVEFAGQTFWVR